MTVLEDNVFKEIIVFKWAFKSWVINQYKWWTYEKRKRRWPTRHSYEKYLPPSDKDIKKTGKRWANLQREGIATPKACHAPLGDFSFIRVAVGPEWSKMTLTVRWGQSDLSKPLFDGLSHCECPHGRWCLYACQCPTIADKCAPCNNAIAAGTSKQAQIPLTSVECVGVTAFC